MPSRPTLLRLLAALVVLCVVVSAVWAVHDQRITRTGAYALAMARVENDPTIGSALGRPISRGLWVGASRDAQLTLRIPLSGTTGDGTLTLVSDEDGADLAALYLEVDGRRTDLLAMDAEKLATRSALEAWTEGAERLEAGQYAEAVAALDEALSLDATMANAWLLRGQAKAALGEPDAAEADLTEAARLDPSDAEIPMALGALYTAARRHEDCVAAYTRVLTTDGEHAEAWYRRAICYEKLRDRRRALAGAREACTGGLEEACRMQDRLRR